MLLVFFTQTVFMLVLLLEVQKGCNGVVDINFVFRIILVIQTIHLSKQAPDKRGLDNWRMHSTTLLWARGSEPICRDDPETR